MHDITRKRSRDLLQVRREPYWLPLSKGMHLGFRRGPDTWIARYRPSLGKREFFAISGDNLSYDDAKRMAEEWLSQMANTPLRSAKRSSVKAALEAYVADLKRHGRADASKDALQRFKLTVWSDPIGNIELEKATKDDFLEWRERLMEGRQPRTVNRLVRAVVAGLNKASDLGFVGNPRSWKIQPLQDEVDDDGETAIFLTAEQRRNLIGLSTENIGQFLRGLELTGARPKELAQAVVSDYQDGQLKLSHRKGKPAKLRTRRVVLGSDGIKFFNSVIRSKLPSAFIFTEDGKQQWRRHMWARRIREVIADHNKQFRGKGRIPTNASAYSFRHARISELLQVYGVDPLTVASQTGTSLAMIEKSYLKFIPSALKEKLRAVK